MDTLLEDMNLYMHLGHTLSINHKIFFTVKKKNLPSVHTDNLHILYGSQYKQQLFPYAVLTGFFLYLRCSV